MSRSSLRIGSMRPSIGSHQLGSINSQKILTNSISNSIRLNPTEEIINLTNNDKIYDYQYRNSLKNKYSGDTKAGKRHGSGQYMFENGDYYIGNWQNDYPSGQGLYIFDSYGKINQPSLAYLGTFQKGYFSGFGKLFNLYSSKEGEFIYQGHWKNGKRQGFGKQHYNEDENFYYAGNWYNDERNGERSNLKFANGQHIGSWENGKMQGPGKLILQQNNNKKTVITGDWINDEIKHGRIIYYKGLQTRQDQIGIYEGQIKDNKREGYGTYKDKYFTFTGNFLNDKPYAEGKMENQSEGFSLQGDFTSEEPFDMNFLQNYRNGDSFKGKGDVVNNIVKRKQGVYNFSNGDSAQGIFEDNVEGQLRGQVVYRWKNGAQKKV